MMGVVQRRTWRALLTKSPLSTTHLLPLVFPRVRTYRGWHWSSVRRAARKVAMPAGRSKTGRGRPLLWRKRMAVNVRLAL